MEKSVSVSHCNLGNKRTRPQTHIRHIRRRLHALRHRELALDLRPTRQLVVHERLRVPGARLHVVEEAEELVELDGAGLEGDY